MTFSNPDFVKYAEAYGCKGHEVTAIEQFIPTLEAAFNEGGVHLVSVPVDYSENQRVLVDELRQAFPATGSGAGPADPPGRCRPWSTRRQPRLAATGRPGPGLGLGGFGMLGNRLCRALHPLTTRFPQIHERSYRYPVDENKLIAERREKLKALRGQGIAYPNDFRREDFAACRKNSQMPKPGPPRPWKATAAR